VIRKRRDALTRWKNTAVAYDSPQEAALAVFGIVTLSEKTRHSILNADPDTLALKLNRAGLQLTWLPTPPYTELQSFTAAHPAGSWLVFSQYINTSRWGTDNYITVIRDHDIYDIPLGGHNADIRCVTIAYQVTIPRCTCYDPIVFGHMGWCLT
jgi:hypothetical protein